MEHLEYSEGDDKQIQFGSNQISKSDGEDGSLDLSLQPCEYTIEHILGQGMFGEVFKAVGKDGHSVAMKRLAKNGERFNWKLINAEVEAGRRLKGNKNVATMVSCFETVNNVYLVFEFVEGIDLFSVMEDRDFRPLEEKDTRQLFKQLVDSLVFCHNKAVAHRDIKLDNVIVDTTGQVKLIDFGLAHLDNNDCSTFVGSPEYVAPEVIKRIPYSGFKADVFSLGMVLFCLLFGQFPFIPEERFEAMANGDPHPSLQWPIRPQLSKTSVSKSAKDLIKRMLEVDPQKRITMEEVAKHRWLHIGEPASKAIPEPTRSLTPSLPEGINVC